MKTQLSPFFILSSLLLIVSAPAFAQIPNASFENWESITYLGRTYNNISGWNTSNYMNVFNNEPEMVTKTTDAYEGIYAASFINKPNFNQMSAMASTGGGPFAEKSGDKFPVTEKVKKLKGYYKYDYTATSDSCSIFVILYKDSNTVGYGEFASGNKVSTFTEFIVNIQYYDDLTPDSASIYIYTTRDNFREGSELVIDALSFETTNTGLFDRETGKTIKASVYPNPAAGNAVIEFEQRSAGRTQVTVYDILGNAVAEPSRDQAFSAGTNQLKWDTTPLSPGIYFIRIKQHDAEKTIRITVNN